MRFDFEVRMQPHLVILSAIVKNPHGDHFIENTARMIQHHDDLENDIWDWVEEINADGFKVDKMVVTFVERSLYEKDTENT